MASWIPMDEACRLLAVRPQTVYAYVSRGKIEVAPDPTDSRRSLYRAEDVATLAKRKKDGRKLETLATNTLFGAEPSITTAICGFVRGRPCYRGEDAIELSRHATLEDTAQRLWAATQPVEFGQAEVNEVIEAIEAATPVEPGRVTAFVTLARLAATGHSTRGRLTRVLHEEAMALVGELAAAFGAKPRQTGDTARRTSALHQRLAAGWGQPAEVAELLRAAMVLLADHELTSSAFSTRIAASTGASLPACLLAGLATFSGPLHGDASGRVRALFDEVERLGDAAVAERYLSAGQPIAGFGHPIYPDGDPRAAELLARFEPPALHARFIARVVGLTGQQPTIDVALAALAARHGLPADAPFALFALARSTGLLAHALEQLGTAQMIRPRGRYIGPQPDSAVARGARI